MASSTTSSITALGGKIAIDLAVSASTSNDNVTSASSGKIYMVQIDNTTNAATFYFKIRDAASASPATSASNGAGTPHLMFACPAYQKITYAIPDGHAYAAGVSIWGTTSVTIGDTTDATNDVIIKLVCS